MSCKALVTSFLLAAASVSAAAADTIFVAATDGPWSISTNPSMPYGINDHTTPAILLLQAGADSVTLTYQGGSATGGILWPPAGPEGYPFNHIYPIEWGCGPGTSGGLGSPGYTSLPLRRPKQRRPEHLGGGADRRVHRQFRRGRRPTRCALRHERVPELSAVFCSASRPARRSCRSATTTTFRATTRAGGTSAWRIRPCRSRRFGL